MRRSIGTRATALVLSWVMPATTAWALAPVVPPPPIDKIVGVPPAFALPLAWGSETQVGPRPRHAETSELGALSEAISAVETAWSGDGGYSGDHHHHHQGCDHDHDSHDSSHYDDDDDPPDSCHRALRPILECVVANGGSSYTAHFGYDSDSPTAVTVPLGTKNKFTPNPSGRGQPTVFQPGRTPAYPQAAFSVPFNGSNLVWTLQGPDHQVRTATASSSSRRCTAPPPPPPTPPPTPCAVSLFGPQKYTRTTGSPNVFTATITVPSWVSSPVTLKVVNGAANGSNRVSSATIKVNNVQVAGPSDFNQNVAGFERSVTLTPQTTLKVTLASAPGSYLTLSLCGGSGDATRPVVTWAAPTEGSTVGTATPSLLVKYQDLVGANEPAASGVDTTSLQVWLDDVDRTALFTRRSGEASADLPAALALVAGPHRVRASIRDAAGNTGEATANFTVDLANPTITIVAPAAGAYLPTTMPTIRIQYADNIGLDLATLKVTVGGQDRTSLFVKTASEAVGTLDAASALPNGAATIQASVNDRAGHPAEASRSFNVDTQAPTIVITKPLAGSRHGTSDVDVIVQYHDDQKLDLDTFDAKLDTHPLAMAKSAEGAVGHPTGLADGPHRVTVLIHDAAGNEATTYADFSVDTAAPGIEIVQPSPGSTINTGTPNVLVAYSDPQGVDTSKFKLFIGGTNRTSWCTVGSASATCTIPPADRLPEGANTIGAEIRDLIDNQGTASAEVTVDTIAPTAALVAPTSGSNVKQSHPEIQVSYGDGTGSGVNPASVHIFVDQVDQTASFARSDSGAKGTLAGPLADGRHDIQITLSDRAGNDGTGSGWFVVDTAGPQATIVAPAPDGFFMDATPAVEVTFADPGGSGVDPATVHVFLIRDPDPPVDVTAMLTSAPDRLTGDLTSVLSDGTYRLRLVVSDRATNTTTVEGGFEIDTVAPSLSVTSPHGYVAVATPTFTIPYHDDGSGIDLTSLAVIVDGTDRASALTADPLQAGGVLPDPLADGAHSLTVSIRDRAGNATQIVEPPFTVDTVAPTAAVTAPTDGAYVGTPQPTLTVTYSDPDVGAPTPLASVVVSVDGVDRTADFAVGPATATATLATPFTDDTHSISADVVDWAGHHFATPVSHFTVDTQPPVVTITAPEEGSYHSTPAVTVSGTFSDSDPMTTVACQVVGMASVPATVSGSGFTCTVTLAEGNDNTVTVTAKDRLDHAGSASRGLKLDSKPPVVTILQPPTGAATSGASIEVSGQVQDDSAVTVVVGTTPAVVEGDSFHATVPLGPGPVEHIVATATDAALNTSSTSVDVTIDRAAPIVNITSPAAEAYLKGPTVAVEGTVTDGSSVMVEVNQQPASVSGPPGAATFSAVVPVVDGRQLIKATAHDAAANTGSDERWINVDSVPPTVIITEPAGGTPTRGASIHVAGTASDASPFTLRVEGQVVPVVNGQFAVDVPLPAEGPRDITVDAVDAAGNAGNVHVTVVVDRTPPALEVVSPSEGAVLGALPVVIVGTVSDATPTTVIVGSQAATRTGDAWQASVGALPEGPYTFTVVATDAAGNETTVTRTVLIDLTAPVVHISTPADGTVTRDGTVTVTGEVEDRSAVTVVVDAGGAGQTAVVTGSGPFNFTATVALGDGDNTITATATDQTSRPGTASVRVTRDSIAPTIELVTPEKLSRGRPGQATVVVTDNLGLGVTFTVSVDGVSAGSFTSSPVVLPLSVPAGKVAGDSFTVSVDASDAAQNPATAQRSVTVISDGVIVGQVLVDTTGLPLPGASVHMTTTSGVLAATTDDRGRYSFPSGDVAAIVSVEKAGMTAVERELTIASGTGTVPVDARPTPLADPKTIVPDGGSLTAGALKVTVGAGAGGAYRLTPLSPQGLPGLLPMGWSPLAAFHLVVPADGGTLNAAITGLPALALYLVEYRPTLHDWTLVASLGTPGSVPLSFDLPGPGSFAAVTADGDAVPLPAAAGDVLTGVPFQMLPATAMSTSVVTPATLPPSGGIALGALHVISPSALPSGTVLQAQVTETFTLSSGEVASEEQRRQDIVLFTHPKPADAALAAEIPITPSRTFSTTELVEGKVHLDILAGRESVRGKTGGREAVQVDSGDVRLGLAKQSLPDDTAIAVEQSSLSTFLPSSASLVPVGEAVVDFAGQRLAFAADLSLADPGVVAPGDTLLVARVERVDGIPRLVVVALAELSGGRVRTIAAEPLPGVREEGRYVFYRSAVPIGFVSGTVTPVSGRALVEMVGPGATPFVALTTADGHYVITVAAGPVTVRAHLLKTALVGDASVTVGAGQAVATDIALVGSVTNATVSPASGALVTPNSQLTLSVDTALDPSTVTAANIKLKKTADASAVALRFVLSGSGKTLTIVPIPPPDAPENAVALEFSTDYRFEASGLKTALAGDVLVPTVNFRTKDDTPPVYNTNGLAFSFPDADGNVTVSAPAGTFPPGTQILIVNGTSGFVATFTAENDGAVGVVLPAIMPATLNDLFIVSVTDPLGNATTFKRSKFVDPVTGNTAIGPGGGVVEGVGGVEMRIPDGALAKGVALKIESVSAAQFATDFPGQVPDLPGAHTGSALKITSDDKPEFKKAVDLAFPLPDFTVLPQNQRPSRPEDAFYYVYRRLALPPVNGVERAAFETIDHAFVEGQGADRKVVTASYPLPMYQTSWGSVDASGHLTSTAGIYCVLLWSYLPLFLGKPLPGVITGKVLRQKFNDNTLNPSTSVDYEPIENALVSGVDANGSPLFNQANATVAVTQEDGTYALFDPRYTGGPVTISAMVGGELRTAKGFEANVADWATTTLRNYANIATANVTFPGVKGPDSPPAIQTLVMRIENGKRTDTGGLVVANTPLIIGFTAKNGDIRSATLQGNDYGIRVDPLRGEPGGTDSVLNPDFTPMEAGSYTVTATALPAIGSAVTSSYTFRVLAAGGGIDTLPNDAPSVITAQTVPKMDATGVPVTVFPQVVFTEPVRRIPGNVHLFDEEGVEVAIKISGISPSSEVIEDLTSADQTVTSLTVQPRTGLHFGTPYRLVLMAGIQDLDTNSSGNAAPKSLTPYETRFVTFGPQGLIDVGKGETFTSPGIVVLGERTYLVQNNFVNGTLRAFDTSDPVLRREILTARATVTWRPVDIAGEEETTISEGRLVVVATSSTAQSKPSNVYLFDTTSDQATRWIGAVSLANSALDGFVNRIAIKDGFLYAATAKKGIQVVDLAQAKAVFEPPGTANYGRMIQSFNTDGQGFGQEAVVQTIPVNDPSGRALMIRDLKVGDFVVDNVSQAVVAATGDAPLVVINPQSSETLAQPAIDAANGSKLSWGQVIALGTIADRRVAVIVGSGITSSGSSTVLAVVDLTNPRLPLVKSVIALDGVTDAVQDVILKGNLALVGTSSRVVLVNIENLSAPVFAGTVSGVAGRLAIDQNDVLLASARSVFGGNDVLGGVRSAALGPLIAIMPVEAVLARPSDAAKLGGNEETLEDVALDVRAYGLPDGSAQIRLYENDVPVGAATSVPLGGGRASLLIPKGRAKQEARLLRAVASASVDGGVFTSSPRLIPYATPRLTIDSNNDTFVDDRDDLAIKTDPSSTFAFWEGTLGKGDDDEPGNGEDELVDYATVRIKLPYEMPSSWRLALQMTGSKFEVKRKLPNSEPCRAEVPSETGKAYLCKPGPSTAQLESFDESPQPEPRGGDQYVLAEPLKPGINEFLIRCPEREDGTRACASDQLYLLALDRRELPATASLVASRKVDIEPFAKVVGEQTVRRSDSYDPKFAQPVPGWKEIPADAATVTVLVHGFNVSEKEAKGSFLPTLAKRLYWAGTPILERQGKAYLTGLLWPGDQEGNPIPFLARFFYPEDEYNALRSGIPVALWLDGLANGSAGRKVNIVAHSLGNMVINNAVKQRYRDLRSPVTYVMLDAAMAAEAFEGAAAPLVPELVDHAKAYGYPSDQRWTDDWIAMNDGRCPECLSRWNDLSNGIGPNVWPPVEYAKRWYRAEPGDRTAWRDYFALNKDVSNLTMFNVYSPNDYVVRTDKGRGTPLVPHHWFACQRFQKPNTGLGDAAREYTAEYMLLDLPDGWRDNAAVGFWAGLGGPSLAAELAANEALFAPGNRGLIRQWAELAFYFPAVSGAAGAQALPTLGARNFSMEKYSGFGYEQSGRDNSHSYFWVKKPADVWKVYETLTTILPR